MPHVNTTNKDQFGASITRQNSLVITVEEDCSLVLIGQKSRPALTICLRFGDVLNQPGLNHTVVHSIHEPLLTKFMGKTLLQSAGKSVTDDVSDKMNSWENQVGHVFSTKAGGLNPSIGHILHVIGPEKSRQYAQMTSTTLSSLYFECFTFTNFDLQCSTIIIPPIGAGNFKNEKVDWLNSYVL